MTKGELEAYAMLKSELVSLIYGDSPFLNIILSIINTPFF